MHRRGQGALVISPNYRTGTVQYCSRTPPFVRVPYGQEGSTVLVRRPNACCARAPTMMNNPLNPKLTTLIENPKPAFLRVL